MILLGRLLLCSLCCPWCAMFSTFSSPHFFLVTVSFKVLLMAFNNTFFFLVNYNLVALINVILCYFVNYL